MGGELNDPPLDRQFYDRPVLAVARDLLGTTVRHGPVALRITEVEAYGGRDDPASHAFRGPTPRSRVMFGPPGHAYIYFVYGLHWCFNVVCGPEGTAAAVLVRAGSVLPAGTEPWLGAPDPRVLAGASPERLGEAATSSRVASGPGRFARCLGVDGGLSGSDLTGGGPISLYGGRPVAEVELGRGPRVGIRVGTELPYRIWLRGEASVSRPPPMRPERT